MPGKKKPQEPETANEPDDFQKEFNPPEAPKRPTWPEEDTPDGEVLRGTVLEVDADGGQQELGVLTIQPADEDAVPVLHFLNKSGSDRLADVMKQHGFEDMNQLVNKAIGISFDGWYKTRSGFRARVYRFGLQKQEKSDPDPLDS